MEIIFGQVEADGYIKEEAKEVSLHIPIAGRVTQG